MPRSPEAMTLASEPLYASIVQRELTHDGDPILTRHVLAATAKSTRAAGGSSAQSATRRSTPRSRSQ
jgi:hypothetical protein